MHSVLKLPLNLAHEELPVYNISESSKRGKMLQQSKPMVWDECTMSLTKAIKALDRTNKYIKVNAQTMPTKFKFPYVFCIL